MLLHLVQKWKSHKNPKISVFLNLTPSNIKILSNVFSWLKNIISDKYLNQNITLDKHLTQKYWTDPPYVCVPSAPLGLEHHVTSKSVEMLHLPLHESLAKEIKLMDSVLN